MRHLRIAERLFNRPLMISEAKLAVLQHLFGQKSGMDLLGLPAAPAPELAEVSDKERRRAGYSARNGVGVIGIHGPLMHRVLEMEFPSGGPTTYADIRRAFDLALVDDEVEAVVLDIDSPGGEVHGAFDLADHIHQARGGKPITAVVNESAFSAAYLLASAADRVVLPRTGGAGSIGVIATHADFSRAEDAAGITVTHVYAGARKADFSPHRPLSPDAVAALQELVNDTYALFVDTVARNRGLSARAVRDTQAAVFEGEKAVAARLADEVSSVDRAVTAARRTHSPAIAVTAAVSATAEEDRTMTLPELREKHPDLVAQIEAEARKGMIAQADADTAVAAATESERARVLDLVSAAVGEETGRRIAAAADKGLTADDLQALGVQLAPAAEGGEARQQMLDAITAAASPGVQGSAAGARPGEAEQRTATASAIAAGGSLN